MWEVSWRPNRTATYWPPLFWLSQLFFPVLLGCSTGGLVGHGPHSSIFFLTHLTFLSPGLYNNLTSTYFLRASQFHTQFNPSTVKVTPDLLIYSTGCTCYVHRCISPFDSLAGSVVNMQHSECTSAKDFSLFWTKKGSIYSLTINKLKSWIFSMINNQEAHERKKGKDGCSYCRPLFLMTL